MAEQVVSNPNKFQMNQDKVKKLTTEKPREKFWDTIEPGLGLQVSRNGRKVWVVSYRENGERVRREKVIGEWPDLTVADARLKASELRNSIKRGYSPSEDRKQQDEAPTFKTVAEQYIERYAKKEKRSWEEDARILEKDLLPTFGKRKAQDIKRKDVLELLDRIAERKTKNKQGEVVREGSPIMANRTLALMRKIYNWAISRDLVEHNPCLQVAAPSAENQRDRVLTETEIKKVWKAFESIGGLMGPMFKLRFLTAQRGGEVEAMRWVDLDLGNGWWTIPAEFSKNGLSHRVPLNDPALGILKQLQTQEMERLEKARQKEKSAKESQWVFPGKSRTPGLDVHISNINKSALKVRDLSGVDFVMHDLRRTAASYMASMGISRLVISKVLNHVETGITRVYDRHTYDTEKRQALHVWGERLTAIVQR